MTAPSSSSRALPLSQVALKKGEVSFFNMQLLCVLVTAPKPLIWQMEAAEGGNFMKKMITLMLSCLKS